jgi:hypothetical protein
LVFLSRDEQSIREHLEEDFEHILAEAHKEDVERFVRADIEQRLASKRLRVRDLSIKERFVRALVDKSQGM